MKKIIFLRLFITSIIFSSCAQNDQIDSMDQVSSPQDNSVVIPVPLDSVKESLANNIEYGGWETPSSMHPLSFSLNMEKLVNQSACQGINSTAITAQTVTSIQVPAGYQNIIFSMKHTYDIPSSLSISQNNRTGTITSSAFFKICEKNSMFCTTKTFSGQNTSESELSFFLPNIDIGSQKEYNIYFQVSTICSEISAPLSVPVNIFWKISSMQFQLSN